MAIKSGLNNIVIAGAWNPAIFSDAWISKNIASSESASISIAFPVNSPGSAHRLSFDDMELFPSAGRLEIRPVHQTLDGSKKAAALANKIVEFLPHTPIAELGVNFVFDEVDNSEALTEKITLGDADALENSGLSLRSTNVQRNFSIDGGALNLKMAFPFSVGDVDDAVRLDFNYTFPVSSAGDCVSRLSTENIERCYQMTIDTLTEIYGIDAKEVGGEYD